MISPINQNWIDKADEKLQKAEVSYWGNAFFYENKLGKALLFLAEVIKYVLTLSNSGFKKNWDKPNYFKITLPQGETTYYDKDAALRIGYSHLLVTLPLHRVKGAIQQDSTKVPNPMHRRKLQLLHALLDDQVAIRASLSLAKKLAIASPKFQQHLDQFLPLQNPKIIEDTLSSIQQSPTLDHKKESDAIVKSVLDRLRQENFQNLDKLYDECVHEEMEKALEAYDFIHPERDAKKYDELTNFLSIRSQNIPSVVLSKEARSVIDLAARIDTVARSNLKIDRKTFLALISGAQMLPVKDVADASVLNKRAYNVAQERFRLVKAGNIRKVLQHTPQEDIQQILEASKKFILNERLEGMKRKAFVEKIKEYITLEGKKEKRDHLLDEKRDIGFFEWLSHKITMKNNYILDPDEIYEVFSQLGLITEDKALIEKRLEVYSFLEAYRSFKHAKFEKYNGDKHLFETENNGNIRYQFANNPKNISCEQLSYADAMFRACLYADNPSILRSETLLQLSETLFEDLSFLRKKVGYLQNKNSITDEDKGKLQDFQRCYQEGFDGLDKVISELKLRNISIPEDITNEMSSTDQFKKYSAALMEFRYLLENRDISQLTHEGRFNKIKDLQKQAKESLKLIEKQLKEGRYVGWKNVDLEQRRIKLIEQIWILGLFEGENLNNVRIIDESEKGAGFGSMEEQVEVLKDAPASIKNLPKTQTFLKELWKRLEAGPDTYPNLIELELAFLRKPDNQDFIKRIQGPVNLEEYFSDLVSLDNLLKYSLPLLQQALAEEVDSKAFREFEALTNLLVSSKEQLINTKLNALYQEFTTDTEMGRLLKRMKACVDDQKFYHYQRDAQANHAYGHAISAKNKLTTVLDDLRPPKGAEQIVERLKEMMDTFSNASRLFSRLVQSNQKADAIPVPDDYFKVDSGIALKLEADEKYKVEPKMIITVIPPGAKETSLEIAKNAYEMALKAVDEELTNIRRSSTSAGQADAVLKFIQGPLLKTFFECARVWEDLIRKSVGTSKDLENLEEIRELSKLSPEEHFQELQSLLKSWDERK